MRLSLLVLAAILASALFVAGFAISPYTASASDLPQEETFPAVTHATTSHNSNIWIDYPLQPSYLSLTLVTDKSVYLSGEEVAITLTTSAYNTHVNLVAQLPDGSQQTIGNFTFNYTHTVSWTAPEMSGQIRLTCTGDALAEVWDYCTRYVCHGDPPDCHFEDYSCLRTITVTGNTYNDINVYSRTASISGRITDTNQHPVPGATVTLLSAGQSTTSNADGYYQFSYQLGNNFGLVNQIPTITDTITVDAVACEPQPGKSVQIQAGQASSGVNFTLNRVFYPPDFDLSEFTYSDFTDWPAAHDFVTWQNIAGITIDGPVQVTRFQYGSKVISPMLFNISNKQLYLITTPEVGSYTLDMQGAPNSQYTVAAAATLDGNYLQPVTVDAATASNGSQRLRLILQQGQIQLQVLKPFPVLAVVIPVIVIIIGGLVAAFFLTGGKKRWGKAFVRQKKSAATEITTTKVSSTRKVAAKSAVKQAMKSTGKRAARTRARSNKAIAS
jgi:hypothetical protein